MTEFFEPREQTVTYPLLPLRDVVVFPGVTVPLSIAGAILVAVAEEGSFEAREVLDQWSWVVALLALVPWVAAHWRRQG